MAVEPLDGHERQTSVTSAAPIARRLPRAAAAPDIRSKPNVALRLFAVGLTTVAGAFAGDYYVHRQTAPGEGPSPLSRLLGVDIWMGSGPVPPQETSGPAASTTARPSQTPFVDLQATVVAESIIGAPDSLSTATSTAIPTFEPTSTIESTVQVSTATQVPTAEPLPDLLPEQQVIFDAAPDLEGAEKKFVAGRFSDFLGYYDNADQLIGVYNSESDEVNPAMLVGADNLIINERSDSLVGFNQESSDAPSVMSDVLKYYRIALCADSKNVNLSQPLGDLITNPEYNQWLKDSCPIGLLATSERRPAPLEAFSYAVPAQGITISENTRLIFKSTDEVQQNMVIGASRTDAGVKGFGISVAFDSQTDTLTIYSYREKGVGLPASHSEYQLADDLGLALVVVKNRVTSTNALSYTRDRILMRELVNIYAYESVVPPITHLRQRLPAIVGQ